MKIDLAPANKRINREKIVSGIMRKVKSQNTSPEIRLRKCLWAHGVRYSTNRLDLPGKPDVMITSKKLAIFVDGDYWHGNQWRRRNLACLEQQFPATKSKDYWLTKIRKNMDRDCAATSSLINSGLRVIRFWESDINGDVESCVQQILAAIAHETPISALSLAPRKTFAEFFAGIGLMRMGLERQGWEVAFANDLDGKKQIMYKSHFKDSVDYALQDVHTLTTDQIPPVSLATASFPCNDLSLAGHGKGLNGSQSSAFWGFLRVIQEMGDLKPPLILLENVIGFLTSSNGANLRSALEALNGLGYTVDAFILDAVHFVPQSRPRLFVVGVMKDDQSFPAGSPEFPGNSNCRPPKCLEFMASNQDLDWNIRPLPAPPNRTTSLNGFVENIPGDSKDWWSEERALRLLEQMSPKHRKIADKMISGTSVSYGTVFRRTRNGRSTAELRIDGVAGCLRTPRGGSARQILMKAGNGRFAVRLLNAIECARLMGAEGFRATGSLNQNLFGFGDAVCVPVIEWIAQHYLNSVISEMMRGRLLGKPGNRNF